MTDLKTRLDQALRASLPIYSVPQERDIQRASQAVMDLLKEAGLLADAAEQPGNKTDGSRTSDF